MALPYVGSTITLISHSEIRYEGTLAEIDKEKQTVSLINVRSFGTEGRRTDLFIKPKPTPYAKIVFRGQDIKDLNVQQPTPQEDPTFHDPAILAHEEAAPASAPAPAPAPSPAPAPATAAQKANAKKSLAEVKKANALARRKKKEEEQKAKAAAAKAAAAKAPKLPEQKDANIAIKAPSTAEDWAARTAGSRFHPTRLNHRWKADEKQQAQHRGNGRPGPYGRNGQRGPVINPADANIDIAATSAALEKEKQKLLESTAVADVAPAYDPSNFFDNLGASGASRTSANPATAAAPPVQQVRARRQNENALNRETFGAVPQQQRRPPNQPRRYPQPPAQQQPFYNRGTQGGHNRYGAHNRTGHHNYKRSQGAQSRGQRY